MAKKEEWPGLGERIRQRIRELGMVTPSGKADIATFTTTHGYVITGFYKWLTNTTPERETLLRLARDLEVSPAWLLFGDQPGGPTPPPGKRRRRKPVPISGGSDGPDPLGVAQLVDNVSLIRRRFGRMLDRLARPMLAPWCPA